MRLNLLFERIKRGWTAEGAENAEGRREEGMNASCFFYVSLDGLLLVWSASLCCRRFADNQFATEYDWRCDRQTAAVLKIVAKENLVLETRHISSEEVMAVVGAGNLLNIKNVLITHAMVDVPGLSLENMQRSAQMGAFLELAFVNDLMWENAADEGHKNCHQVSISQMAAAIKLIGAEHFVLTTDLGRKPDPLPAEGYKLFVEKLMGEGISGREIDLMMKENPARLLGI